MSTDNKNSKNKNTELCVDLKTILLEDRIAEMGKKYVGVIKKDKEDHFLFVEMAAKKWKRNPHLFEGKYITITLRDDGSLRLNFKPVEVPNEMFLNAVFCSNVYQELLKGLDSLVEKNI